MKPLKLLLIIFAVSAMSANAQSKSTPIVINSEYDKNDNSLVISAEKKDSRMYTVVFTFQDVKNTLEPGNKTVILKHDGEIFRLMPLDEKQYAWAKFSYRYFQGWISPDKINEKVVYRLPYSTSKTIKVGGLYNINDRYFGGSDTENWKSFHNMMEKGDTIYAMRRGVVVEAVDKYGYSQNSDISFSTQSNQILIEHSDGTMARYDVLDHGSFMVNVGDLVNPGDPLALAGSYDSKKYELKYYIFYWKWADSKVPSHQNAKLISSYIDPVFATTEGDVRLAEGKSYTPIMNDRILTAEMSKRESKKLKK